MYRAQDHRKVVFYHCLKIIKNTCHKSMPRCTEKPGVQRWDTKSNPFILLCSGKASTTLPKAQQEPGPMEKSSEEIARKVKNWTYWEDWKTQVAALGEKMTAEKRC